jgi:outer membrane protein TolC
MGKDGRILWGLLLLAAPGFLSAGCAGPGGRVCEQLPPADAILLSADEPPKPIRAASLGPCDTPLPINLPTALKLADVRPIDVAVASQRIELAAAQLQQAQAVWLPTVYLGADYSRHDGQVQDAPGNVFGTSKSSLLLGAGPSAVFALSDAIFGPLSARQVLQARESTLQTARNDSLLAVAEAYFNVQEARGDLAGAEDVARRADDLVRRAEDLARKGEIIPELEVVRARAQAARNRQAVQSARERWRVASANLVRVLRLDPAAVVEPLEPPHLRVTLVPPDRSVDDLIRVGLTNRPELAAQQALVQATLERLRQERLRPLIPSILIRGASTPVTGTLAGGYFGGGRDDQLGNFSARSDFDVQVLWELRNLGFGNRALVGQQRAENQLALLELFRTQDRVAAEVAQAFAEAQSAAARLRDAEAGLRDAVDSADKNLQGLGETKSAGKVLVLVIRPQEVVAAIQALSQAYADYYAAIADYDRAQFRLYHALGHPAQALAGDGAACPLTLPDGTAPPARPPEAPARVSTQPGRWAG